MYDASSNLLLPLVDTLKTLHHGTCTFPLSLLSGTITSPGLLRSGRIGGVLSVLLSVSCLLPFLWLLGAPLSFILSLSEGVAWR